MQGNAAEQSLDLPRELDESAPTEADSTTAHQDLLGGAEGLRLIGLRRKARKLLAFGMIGGEGEEDRQVVVAPLPVRAGRDGQGVRHVIVDLDEKPKSPPHFREQLGGLEAGAAQQGPHAKSLT